MILQCIVFVSEMIVPPDPLVNFYVPPVHFSGESVQIMQGVGRTSLF